MYKNDWKKLARKFLILGVLFGCLMFLSSDLGSKPAEAAVKPCCSSCEFYEESCHNTYPYGSPELEECFERYVMPCYRWCTTSC